MSRVHVLALASALALVPTLAGAVDGVPLPKGIDAGPCVEGICEYRLPNGMRVLLFPDASKPTVTVNLTYGVGSVHENYGESGMAHLLEHLVFKGTPRHRDIPGEMKKRGIGYNGTTSLDRTNYFASFPANDATLDWLLGMEADRMVNSFIAKKDLDSEMTVVRNELERNENNPASVMGERLRSTAYLWHNYGNTTIGARSDVENVPIENLQAFYRRWYQPDNATLVVAGRIDPAKTLALVNKYFAPLRKPVRVLPRAHTIEPVQDGEREVTVRRSGDMRLVGLMYHTPAATHADAAALRVLGNILSHTPGGRLHKALVETRIAAGAGGGAGMQRDASSMTFVAMAPKDGDAAKTEAALLEQVEALASRPVTEAELAEAKRRMANGYEDAYNNVNGIGIALSEYVAIGDWRLWFVLRDAVDRVTVDDVNRVARTYLIPSNRTLARFVPTDNAVRAVIPAAPSVASLVEGYRGRAAVAAGEAFESTPQNIAQRTEVVQIGDLRVSLLPRKTRGNTVVLSGNFRFNDLDAIRRSPSPAASFAGSLLMRGAQGLSREEIDRRFDSLKTGAGIGGGIQGASVNLSSKRDQLPEALRLAARVLRTPTFPEAEFEQLRMQARTGIAASRKEPGTVIAEAMGPHFDPWPAGHPFRHKSLDEQERELDALKIEDVRAFHRNHYGTSAGEIAVVGDFDPALIKPLIRELFADWKPAVAYTPVPTRYFAVAPETRRFETPDKANAVYSARMNIALKDTDPDYQALLVANRIFGGGGMSSRLGDRVRQKDGLSYGIGSGISADASVDGTDDAGSFVIQGTAAPQNMDKLAKAVQEELLRFVRDGITQAELDDAVNAMRVERDQGRVSDGAIAGMLNSDQYLRRPMLRRAEQDAALKTLTLVQVNAAIRRHIDPARLSVYMAGDFAAAARK